MPGRALLLIGEAHPAGYLRGRVDNLLELDQTSSDDAQCVVENTIDEASVCTATPNWCTVCRSRVDQR